MHMRGHYGPQHHLSVGASNEAGGTGSSSWFYAFMAAIGLGVFTARREYDRGYEEGLSSMRSRRRTSPKRG